MYQLTFGLQAAVAGRPKQGHLLGQLQEVQETGEKAEGLTLGREVRHFT